MTSEENSEERPSSTSTDADVRGDTRVSALYTIEQSLEALGMPYRDLDSAFRHDNFTRIRNHLEQLRDEAGRGGNTFRVLMPDSREPVDRLSEWILWLDQYGRFLAEEQPKEEETLSTADRIRQFVIDKYITPARARNRPYIEVPVRTVHDRLELTAAFPNVCQALASRKFLTLVRLPAPTRIGPEKSSTTVFRYDLRGSRASKDFGKQEDTAKQKPTQSARPSDADRIRDFALQRYVLPARAKGRSHVEVPVREIHDTLGLRGTFPNIYHSLAGRKFQSMANVPAPTSTGTENSSTAVFRYDLRGSRSPKDFGNQEDTAKQKPTQSARPSDADRIRDFALQRYVLPARAKGRSHVEVPVREIHDTLGLRGTFPNIYQSLAGRKFQSMANVPAPTSTGTENSSTAVFRYDLRGSRSPKDFGNQGDTANQEPKQSARPSDADRIRDFALRRYILPARAKGRSHVEVPVREIHDALGLRAAFPNICQSLAGRKFQSLASVPAPTRTGPEKSSSTVFRYDLRGSRSPNDFGNQEDTANQEPKHSARPPDAGRVRDFALKRDVFPAAEADSGPDPDLDPAKGPATATEFDPEDFDPEWREVMSGLAEMDGLAVEPGEEVLAGGRVIDLDLATLWNGEGNGALRLVDDARPTADDVAKALVDEGHRVLRVRSAEPGVIDRILSALED